MIPKIKINGIKPPNPPAKPPPAACANAGVANISKSSMLSGIKLPVISLRRYLTGVKSISKDNPLKLDIFKLKYI